MNATIELEDIPACPGCGLMAGVCDDYPRCPGGSVSGTPPTTPVKCGTAAPGQNQEPSSPMRVMAQGKTDFELEAIDVGGLFTILTPDFAVYVTKKQVMEFYNLTE